MKRPVLRALRSLGTPGYDRAQVVAAVAAALDLVTPLGLIPGVGPVLELATDAIWPTVAEALVAEIERAIQRGRQ